MTSTSNIARLQSDKDLFEKRNGALHKEYIPARTTDEIFAKVQKEVDDYSEKAERAKIILCRIDDPKAIDVGNSLGINLYQGRYIQRLLNQHVSIKK